MARNVNGPIHCGAIAVGGDASVAPVSLPVSWALADQPTLTGAEAGYTAFVTDYGHFVRWTGSVWQFAPGDVGNGFRRDYAIAPQEVGWQLMDGSATTYLVVGGATLTTAAYTTPNLTGSPAFFKSIAAYTGTIESAVAPALSGSTAGATATISGTSAAESSHTHGATAIVQVTVGADPYFPITGVSAGTAHSHGAGSLAVDSHTHTAGTLAADTTARPPSVGWLPYFRR